MKDLLSQLDKERRRVDFDTFDISVKELVSMAELGIIDIAPVYQRQFRWPEENQSKFIESVFLGIPIPSLFMAANKDGSWELIDGVQRLNTLIHFAGNKDQLKKFGFKAQLKLKNLDVLTDFKGISFDSMLQDLKLKFMLRPIKVTTLSDKSDLKVRFDLFERLNTGGIKLTNQEIRACVFRGQFNDFITELSNNSDFNKIVKLQESKKTDGTKEELILKFFGYFYKRNEFEHSVVDFLNSYMESSSKDFKYNIAREIFEKTFKQLRISLPIGILRGNRRLTPINLYEAVAVGAADAVSKGIDITNSDVSKWINDIELKNLTTGATNSRKRLVDRISYCYRRFTSNV